MPEDLITRLLFPVEAPGAAEAAKNLSTVGAGMSDVLKKTAQNLTPVTKRSEKLNEVVARNRERMNTATIVADKYNVSASKIVSWMQQQDLQFSKSGKHFQRHNKNVMRLDEGMKKLRRGMKPFQMELLSVMFFGMAIQRTFGGMVKQVMELTGVFEVWRATLIMLLLPILLPLSNVLMEIMFLVMKHPELGKFVGWFIILAAVFGSLLAYVGIVGLGLKGIATWAPMAKLVEWFGKGGILSRLGVTISGGVATVLAVITAIAYGIYLAFQENFAKIRDWGDSLWDSLKKSFRGAIDVIKGVWKIFTSFFKGDIDGLIEGIELVFSGLWKIFWGLGEAIYEAIVIVGIGAFRALVGAINTIIGALNKALEAVKLDWRIPKFEEFAPPGAYAEWRGKKQYGGYISRGGLYSLHAGETVVPAGGAAPFTPNITIHANIASTMDIKYLADKLSYYMGQNFEREYERRAI